MSSEDETNSSLSLAETSSTCSDDIQSNNDCQNVDEHDSVLQKKRQYQRLYYNKRYHTDEQFKKTMNQRNNANYKRITKNCITCGTRMKLTNEEERCIICRLGGVEQIKASKSAGGRPKKINPINHCPGCQCNKLDLERN